MLTFLRRIRKNMIERNRAGKYTLYALGEIALVVIGILIALQINNWSERNKDADYERKVLTEMLNSLTIDLEFFYRLDSRISSLTKASSEIIGCIEGKLLLSDEHFTQKADSSFWGVRLSSDIGAYESLKSKGLHMIKNDPLRESIIRYYEVSVPRSLRQNEDVLKRYWEIREMYHQKMLENDLIEFLPRELGDGLYGEETIYHQNRLLESKLFREAILYQLERLRNHRNRIDVVIERTVALIDQIRRSLSD